MSNARKWWIYRHAQTGAVLARSWLTYAEAAHSATQMGVDLGHGIAWGAAGDAQPELYTCAVCGLTLEMSADDNLAAATEAAQASGLAVDERTLRLVCDDCYVGLNAYEADT